MILYHQSVKDPLSFSTLILSWMKKTLSLSPGVWQTMDNWSRSLAEGFGFHARKNLTIATYLEMTKGAVLAQERSFSCKLTMITHRLKVSKNDVKKLKNTEEFPRFLDKCSKI